MTPLAVVDSSGTGAQLVGPGSEVGGGGVRQICFTEPSPVEVGPCTLPLPLGFFVGT